MAPLKKWWDINLNLNLTFSCEEKKTFSEGKNQIFHIVFGLGVRRSHRINGDITH